MTEFEDNKSDKDKVPPLKVPDKPPKHFKNSPNIRRHLSAPVIDLEKLVLTLAQEQKESEDEGNASAPPMFDISMIKESMKQNPVQFAEELHGLTENITQQKSLRDKHVVDRLLNVMNFWIQHYGIEAIREQQTYAIKYNALSSDHEEEINVLQQNIEVYKKECIQHQEQRKISDTNNKELSTKLKDVTQQLQDANYFAQQCVELRDELEQKSTQYDNKLETIEDQKKRINELESAQNQFEKVIESQHIKLTQMELIENEIKKKTNEINDAHKNNKIIEAQLERIKREKEELHEEKTLIHNKLTDYGKLKDNLSQSEENEKRQEAEIVALKKRYDALQNELSETVEILKEETAKVTEQLLCKCTENDMNLNEIKVQQNTIDQLQSDKMELEEAQNMKLAANMKGEKETDEELNVKPMIEEGGFIEFTLGNNEGKKRTINGYASKYKTMYRSFVIVGVSCLCYLVYAQIYYGSSLHKVNEIRERYRKWMHSVNMKKRVTRKRILTR